MKQTKQSFIIMSSHNREASDEENLKNEHILSYILSDINVVYKPVFGCYKGDDEASVLIPIDFAGEIEEAVVTLCNLFHQESYLKVSGDRSAQLIYTDEIGGYKNIGKFVNVTAQQACEVENYTYDPETAKYYIVRGL